MKSVSGMNIGELGAFVCSHLTKEGIDVVLTGGACVAVYSDHQVLSYDLDFVENLASSRRVLKKALRNIGFEEKGRYFKHPDTDFFLEFPPGPLALGDEPPQQIVALHYATGELKALSATDCVKDRLAAFFHWNDRECLEQALLVALGNEIDLSEVKRWSDREGQKEKFRIFSELYESGEKE